MTDRPSRAFRAAQTSRARIASAAARLMAEDGVTDIGRAKEKAARQLGLPASASLPDNAEVETELRLYQTLHQGDTQPEILRRLRREAADLMAFLADFRPYLTGPVLEGTAGAFSAIDLLLFADSAKEVEIFLLDQGLPVTHADPRQGHHWHNHWLEAILRLATPLAEANLSIFPPHCERHAFKHRDGRLRQRIRLEALEALLENA
ncbi:MAG: hypothetical protein LBO00_09795 [Zoogloeaceae bacterium]|jgi:hypothetical protein|nr:hypothetical protein [Zoogloeaceae bacterium]